MMLFKRKKQVTLVSPDGKRKVKIPDTDELLSERKIKKILKKAGISEEEYIEAYERGDFD
jgi:hypothetical protein